MAGESSGVLAFRKQVTLKRHSEAGHLIPWWVVEKPWYILAPFLTIPPVNARSSSSLRLRFSSTLWRLCPLLAYLLGGKTRQLHHLKINLYFLNFWVQMASVTPGRLAHGQASWEFSPLFRGCGLTLEGSAITLSASSPATVTRDNKGSSHLTSLSLRHSSVPKGGLKCTWSLKMEKRKRLCVCVCYNYLFSGYYRRSQGEQWGARFPYFIQVRSGQV